MITRCGHACQVGRRREAAAMRRAAAEMMQRCWRGARAREEYDEARRAILIVQRQLRRYWNRRAAALVRTQNRIICPVLCHALFLSSEGQSDSGGAGGWVGHAGHRLGRAALASTGRLPLPARQAPPAQARAHRRVQPADRRCRGVGAGGRPRNNRRGKRAGCPLPSSCRHDAIDVRLRSALKATADALSRRRRTWPVPRTSVGCSRPPSSKRRAAGRASSPPGSCSRPPRPPPLPGRRRRTGRGSGPGRPTGSRSSAFSRPSSGGSPPPSPRPSGHLAVCCSRF